MTKKATLYTPAALNGGWLLISIDTALWLHKSAGFEQITIKTVSNLSTFNFFNLLLRFKNLSSYLTKNKLNKLKKLIISPNSKNYGLSNLASFAIGKSDQARLNIDDLEIKFVRIKLGKKNSILNKLTLSYRVLFDYFKFFRNSALKNKVYLKYQFVGIHAGLHVLSEALRSDYKSFGSIFHCRIGILAALYKLYCSIPDRREIDLLTANNSFVCGPAQEYIYGFFSRFMSNRGAHFIDTNNTQKPYIKRKLNDKYYSRLNLSQINNDFLIVNKEKIKKYYNSRIEKPWEALDYMHFLKERDTSNEKTINLNGVSVILYLHSFTDAQYIYGYDGYHDIMDWCLSTISLLNSNEHVSRVIVKPHPGINPIYHPGDTLATKHLKSQLSNFNKVQWADFHFDVNHINNSGKVVGITHHGSIAEELVFSKIPVIASTYSYWGEEYKFGYWWKDIKDYKTLISSGVIKELKVTENHTDELNRFAMDKYFNTNSEISFNIDSTWRDMLKIYDGVRDCHEHGENMEQINYLVSRIDPQDEQFKEYISTRLQKINYLSDVDKRKNTKI